MSTKAAPPDTKYQPRPSAKQVVITAGSPSGMAATASATAILQNSADDRPYQSISVHIDPSTAMLSQNSSQHISTCWSFELFHGLSWHVMAWYLRFGSLALSFSNCPCLTFSFCGQMMVWSWCQFQQPSGQHVLQNEKNTGKKTQKTMSWSLNFGGAGVSIYALQASWSSRCILEWPQATVSADMTSNRVTTHTHPHPKHPPSISFNCKATWWYPLPSRRAMNRIKEVFVVNGPNLTRIAPWSIAMHSIIKMTSWVSNTQNIQTLTCDRLVPGLGLQNTYPDFLLYAIACHIECASAKTRHAKH